MGRRSTDALGAQVYGGGVSRREGMNAAEIADVLAWKARTRAGWQACAQYCGRSVADVRAACEVRGGGSVLTGKTATVVWADELASMVGTPFTIAGGNGPPSPRGKDLALPKVRLTADQIREKTVLKALEAGPGTPAEIGERCRYDENHTRATLNRLLKRGEVVRRMSRGRRSGLWALPGVVLPEPEVEPIGPAVISKEDQVAAAMSETPLSLRELAEATGLSRPFVGRVVKSLVATHRAAFGGLRKKARGMAIELWVRL
jgi:DNA-binding CsgD family transcriptional regulator